MTNFDDPNNENELSDWHEEVFEDNGDWDDLDGDGKPYDPTNDDNVLDGFYHGADVVEVTARSKTKAGVL